jgi:hypothetical protein
VHDHCLRFLFNVPHAWRSISKMDTKEPHCLSSNLSSKDYFLNICVSPPNTQTSPQNNTFSPWLGTRTLRLEEDNSEEVHNHPYCRYVPGIPGEMPIANQDMQSRSSSVRLESPSENSTDDHTLRQSRPENEGRTHNINTPHSTSAFSATVVSSATCASNSL